MALFVKDSQQRSRLQTKVQAGLDDKQKQVQNTGVEPADTDPKFLEKSHQTRTVGMVVSLLAFVLLVVIFVWAVLA